MGEERKPINSILLAWAKSHVDNYNVPAPVLNSIVGVAIENNTELYHEISSRVSGEGGIKAYLMLTQELMTILYSAGYKAEAMLLFKVLATTLRRYDYDMVKFAILVEQDWEEAYYILCSEYLTEDENKLLQKVQRKFRMLSMVVDAIRGIIVGATLMVAYMITSHIIS